jgi:hypothetical protein
MNKFVVYAAISGIAGAGLMIGLGAVSAVSQQQELPLSGTVQRVWEDGFLMEADNRTLTVDTWNLCGDSTAQNLQPGEQVTLIGEMDGREFDAFSVTKANGNTLCATPEGATTATPEQPQNSVPGTAEHTQGQAFTGPVQRAWEDGFSLAAGDRTFTVDTWTLCGDNTNQFVTAGDTVTITGEFEAGEFDAFSLTTPEGEQVCR